MLLLRLARAMLLLLSSTVPASSAVGQTYNGGFELSKPSVPSVRRDSDSKQVLNHKLEDLIMTQTECSNGREKKQIQEDIEKLKDWLEKQPHLPHNVEDDFLSHFVSGTKSLEIAKQKLDVWFSAKHKLPQIFSPEVWDPFTKEMKDSVKAVKMFFLPKLSPEGYVVQWIKIGEDFSLFNHPQLVVRNLVQLQIALDVYPESKGYMCVYDMAGINSSLIAKISPTSAGYAIQWFQSGFPMKLKKAILVNSSSFVQTIINSVIKPVLKAKLVDRITVTSESEKFISKDLPIEMFPEEYGGKAQHSSVLNEEWQRKLEEKADWLQEISKLVSDEKKRPADSNCTYGVEGTFRKLALD